VRAGAGVVVADGVDRAEGCARVILIPLDPALRERIASIRLSVDRATGLVLRAVVDSPAQQLTLTLSDYRQDASLEDAVFEPDVSRLNVEEK
jgi:outer membrane lipoprotein-sorting protein